MTRWNPTHWGPYTRFHARQLASGDLDPAYPVLRHVCSGMTPARTVWTVALYVAFYDLGSGLTAADTMPRPTTPPPELLTLPCGTERRGHRDQRRLHQHLTALRDYSAAHDGLHQGFTRRIHRLPPEHAWIALCDELTTLHGNGRWAAYKTAEVLQHVADYPVRAPDMGHAHSTGPRKGLALLHPIPSGNSPAAVRQLDRLSRELVADLHAEGLPAEPATAETTLCDYHSAVHGRYYTGHDIDKMGPQLGRAPQNTLVQAAWTARRHVFPKPYLGELGGWHGTSRTLAQHHLAKGVPGDRGAP